MRLSITAAVLFSALIFANSSAIAADDEDDDGLSDTKLPPTISCGEYKDRLRSNLSSLKGLAPDPVYKMVGLETLNVNFYFMRANINCDTSGMLSGVGATLIEYDEKYKSLWNLFLTAIIQSVNSSYGSSDARKKLNSLETEAISNAQKNSKEQGGMYAGSGELDEGNYYFDYSPVPNPASFSISLRYAPSK